MTGRAGRWFLGTAMGSEVTTAQSLSNDDSSAEMDPLCSGGSLGGQLAAQSTLPLMRER